MNKRLIILILNLILLSISLQSQNEGNITTEELQDTIQDGVKKYRYVYTTVNPARGVITNIDYFPDPNGEWADSLDLLKVSYKKVLETQGYKASALRTLSALSRVANSYNKIVRDITTNPNDSTDFETYFTLLNNPPLGSKPFEEFFKDGSNIDVWDNRSFSDTSVTTNVNGVFVVNHNMFLKPSELTVTSNDPNVIVTNIISNNNIIRATLQDPQGNNLQGTYPININASVRTITMRLVSDTLNTLVLMDESGLALQVANPKVPVLIEGGKRFRILPRSMGSIAFRDISLTGNKWNSGNVSPDLVKKLPYTRLDSTEPDLGYVIENTEERMVRLLTDPLFNSRILLFKYK